MEEDGALDLMTSGPLAAINVLNSTLKTGADTQVLYHSYI